MHPGSRLCHHRFIAQCQPGLPFDNSTDNVTFVWDNSTVTGADNYIIWVGTAQGGRNLYQSSDLGTTNSVTIDTTGWTTGSRVYVRLFTANGHFMKFMDRMVFFNAAP